MLKKRPLFGSLTGLLLAFFLIPQLALANSIDLKAPNSTVGPAQYGLQYKSVKLSQDPRSKKCIAAFTGLKLIGRGLGTGTVLRFSYKLASQEYKVSLNEANLAKIIDKAQDIPLQLEGTGVCKLNEDAALTVSLTPAGSSSSLTGQIDDKTGLTIDSQALALVKKNATAGKLDDLPEFAVTLRVTKQADRTVEGTLSFAPVKGATVYRVYEQGQESDAVYFSVGDHQDANGQLNLDLASFPGVNTTDVFIVEAYSGDVKDADFSKKTLDPKITRLLKMIARGSSAAQGQGTVRALTEFGPVTGLADYLSYIFKYALPIGAILSILVTMWAGVRVLFNPGSPEKTKAAFDDIKGTILGLVLLIFTHLLYQSLKIPITDNQRGNSPIIDGLNPEVEGRDEPAAGVLP